MVLFSVIVPVYNVEKYVSRCIESILKQSYKKYEVILVDDGSTDESGKICDKYAERYSQCRVIHQKNNGLASARNTGLKYAQGKYIVFVDSDDYIEKELLTKAYYYMEEQEYDAFSFAVRRVNEKEEFLYVLSFLEGIGTYTLVDEKRTNFLLTFLLQYKLGWEAWVYIYRKDIVVQNNISFNESMKYAEDMPFTVEYMLYVEKVIKIPDILYNYTVRKESITKVTDTKRMIDGIFGDVFSNILSVIDKSEGYLYYAALLNFYVPIILREMDRKAFKEILIQLNNWQEQKIQCENIGKSYKTMQDFFGKGGKAVYDISMYLLK